MVTTPRSPQTDAIAAVLDVLKLETTLSTGVLVFSIGLVTSTNVIFGSGFRWLFIVAWIVLGISVLSGVVALFYAPALYVIPDFTLDSNEMRIATALNQLCFVVGSLLIGLVLCLSLYAIPAREEGRIRTPIAAARAAVDAATRRGSTTKRVKTIELLTGTDPARLASSAWHVELDVERGVPIHAGTNVQTIDVYVDPTSGVPYIP